LKFKNGFSRKALKPHSPPGKRVSRGKSQKHGERHLTISRKRDEHSLVHYFFASRVTKTASTRKLRPKRETLFRDDGKRDS